MFSLMGNTRVNHPAVSPTFARNAVPLPQQPTEDAAPVDYVLQTQSKVARELLDHLDATFRPTPEQAEMIAQMIDGVVAECLGVEPPDPFDNGIREHEGKAMDSAARSALAEMAAIRTAEKEVEPVVGKVSAQTSAGAVYKLALDHMSIDVRGVHPSAYETLFRKARQMRRSGPLMGMDADRAAKVGGDAVKRFPALAAIRQA